MFGSTHLRLAAASLLAFCVAPNLNAQVSPPATYSSSVNKNYVRIWEPSAPIQAPNALLTASLKEVKEYTEYSDGLGRPLQTVVRKGSLFTDSSAPTSSTTAVDLVTAITYDEFGRERYKYLPFAANGAGGNTSLSDGLFKLNAFQQQATFAEVQYPLDTFFYSKTNFEASPLNRVSSFYAVGDSWVGSESNGNPDLRRGTTMQYALNEANDSVRIWALSGGNLSSSSMYAAGQLYKLVTIDEHKNKGIEYKDKTGKVILRKVQLDSLPMTGHDGWLCTYYVYDDQDLVRYVLQPKAVELLLTTGWSMTSDILNELTFQYEYDSRNRLIVKKTPSAGELRMVYDKWDRLVLMQDANLRTNKKWLFTKYDHLNRPIMTGIYVNTTDTTQSALQSYLNSQNLARFETFQTATFPLYSLTLTFPSVSFSDVLTITYYDDYTWASWYGSYAAKDNTWDSEFATPSDSNWPYPQSLTQSSRTRGLITGVWDNTGSGILKVTYYDDKARVVQTRTYNYTTGMDFETFQYNFAGQPLQSVLRHQKAGTNSQTHLVQSRLTYDEANRLVKIEKKLSSTIGSTTLAEGWHTAVNLEYDALGQLRKKRIGPGYSASGLDSLTYTYNIRGWLSSINQGYLSGSRDGWFGLELSYDRQGYATYGTYRFNQSIAGTAWRSKGDGERRKFDFAYDRAGRLFKANFTQLAGATWDLSAGIDYSLTVGDGVTPRSAYDANGNIKAMRHRGWKLAGAVTVDSLIYEMHTASNRLKYIRDANNDPNTRLEDFREPTQNSSDNLNSGMADYAYDTNGNIIADANKSIDTITYNHLNLPTYISVTAKGYINYVYDNEGTKLKKVLNPSSGSSKTTLYLSGFVYENDTLQYLLHEDGRIRLTANGAGTFTGYAFDYFERDHLGNVRLVLTEKRDTAVYPEASMETGNLGRDTLYYSKIIATRVQRSGISGYPNNVAYTNPDDWISETNGSGNKIGPGIVLKVMAGDKFTVRASSWYKLNGASPQTPNSPLSDLIAALISGLGGAPGGKATTSELSNTGIIGPEAISFYSSHNSADSITKPKAFVNWVLFDEQLKYVSSSSGFDQVGSDQQFKVHLLSDLPIHKSGYLYVYVSNETPNISVFFDNLQVTHYHGPLLEENQYYPFGLSMAGLSSRAFGGVQNRYKFNSGTELNTDLDLGLYETDYRLYDPQIGRFWQVDELGESAWEWSAYNFALNDPAQLNDPLGLEAEGEGKKYEKRKDGVVQEVLTTVYVTGKHSYRNLKNTYWYYIDHGIPFDQIQDKALRNWMYREDRIQKYMDRVHAATRVQAEVAVEIGLLFAAPEALLTKIKYVKYAANLLKFKRLRTLFKGKEALVQINRRLGNAFRDELADLLRKEGREVATEVYKKTPFGKRFIDIEVSMNGRVLGGIETKVGNSRYTVLQRLKDWYLEAVQGYPVNLVRRPANW
jgi:RHS repeat-associated protein